MIAAAAVVLHRWRQLVRVKLPKAKQHARTLRTNYSTHRDYKKKANERTETPQCDINDVHPAWSYTPGGNGASCSPSSDWGTLLATGNVSLGVTTAE